MHETFTFFNSWVDIEVKLHWINEVDHGIVSVDGSEIPFPTTVGMLRKTLEIMGFQLPTSTGEFTGFLNHQQYGMSMWNVKLRTSKRIATSTAWNRCCFLYRLWGSISSRAYYSDLLRRQRGRWIRFLLHLQGQFLQRSLVTFPHELIKAPHLRFVGKRYPRLLFSPWPRVHGNSLEFLSNFGCNLPWPPRAHRIRLDRKPMAIALLQWKPIVQRSQAHHRRRQIFSVDEKFWPCLFSNVGKVCIFCHVATFPFSEPIASPLLFLHSPLYQVCPWRPSHGGIANAADPPCLDSKGDETGQPTNGPFAHGDTCEPKCQDGYTRSSTFGWKNWKVKEVIIEMMHSVFFFVWLCFSCQKKSNGLVCLQIWKSPVEIPRSQPIQMTVSTPEDRCWLAPLRAIQITNRIPGTGGAGGKAFRFQLRSFRHWFLLLKWHLRFQSLFRNPDNFLTCMNTL